MSDYDFAKLEKLLIDSEVTHTEFAKLCLVSRQTVYNWVTTGRGPNQKLLRGKVVRGIGLIEAALNAGALPRPRIDGRQPKFSELGEVLRKFV